MTTYAEAIGFLEGFIDYEKHRGLMKYNTRALHIRRFERFLRAIGSPHWAVPVVHIAGTKGKGSTAAILHSIAAEAGLTSGLFTSPHLSSYCERIQIDRQPIDRRAFARAVAALRRKIEAANHALEPGYRTTFELLVTLALEVFRERAVGLAILETGLGGRLDATNVVRPEVAVVTTIGLDHTHLLGATHGAIAREKAGIAKPGRPTVLARQGGAHGAEVRAAVAEVCRRKGSPLVPAARLVAIDVRIESLAGQRVRCRLHRSRRELDIFLPLAGRHQAENLRTALAAVEVLRGRGWAIPEAAIVAGVARTRWPGRIERLEGHPPLILDGAHCPVSVEALAATLRAHLAARPVFLFSLLDDKPVEPTLAPLGRLFAGCPVIAFRAPSVRGRDPEALLAPLRRLGLDARAAATPGRAVRLALALAGQERPVVAFGSLYSIEPLRNAYLRLTGPAG